jgi:hypothetical protein
MNPAHNPNDVRNLIVSRISVSNQVSNIIQQLVSRKITASTSLETIDMDLVFGKFAGIVAPDIRLLTRFLLFETQNQKSGFICLDNLLGIFRSSSQNNGMRKTNFFSYRLMLHVYKSLAVIGAPSRHRSAVLR